MGKHHRTMIMLTGAIMIWTCSVECIPWQRTLSDTIHTGLRSIWKREIRDNITLTAQQQRNQPSEAGGKPAKQALQVVSWNYSYVQGPLMVCLFLVVAAALKIGFHHAEFLSCIVPESCYLIVFGTAAGAVLYFTGNADGIHLYPRTFMLFLLPPIVLDSAYNLHDRVFFANIGTIVLYAVVGTLMNCFLIGPALYGLAWTGAMGNIELSLIQCLVFSSFIVAVDPVAVLAIFQEVGVHNMLYFLVFGESLLNDAVTIVLYKMMKSFTEMPYIPAKEIGVGFASFFTVSLGGLSVGILFGTLTALVTKRTMHIKVVEPLAVLVLAYMSYLCAELFHWSGIISTIGCGLVQSEYAFHNISRKSHTTVKYFIKTSSGISDCIIFLFLGLELVRSDHVWHTGFVLWTILLCLLCRLISVFSLTFMVNRLDRVHPIGIQEQFIMWYGGLRGAVAFALCDTMDGDTIPHKDMFMTTTFSVIILTVFVQGMTVKPLVKLCKIKRQEEKSGHIAEEINVHVTDHVMAGIETLIDQNGNNFYRAWLNNINDQYLKKWLQRAPSKTEERILQLYQKMALKELDATLDGSMEDKLGEDNKAFNSDEPIVVVLGNKKALEAKASYGSSIGTDDRSSEQKERPPMTPSPSLRRFRSRSESRSESVEAPSTKEVMKLLRRGSSLKAYRKRLARDMTRDEDSDLEIGLQRLRLHLPNATVCILPDGEEDEIYTTTTIPGLDMSGPPSYTCPHRHRCDSGETGSTHDVGCCSNVSCPVTNSCRFARKRGESRSLKERFFWPNSTPASSRRGQSKSLKERHLGPHSTPTSPRLDRKFQPNSTPTSPRFEKRRNSKKEVACLPHNHCLCKCNDLIPDETSEFNEELVEEEGEEEEEEEKGGEEEETKSEESNGDDTERDLSTTDTVKEVVALYTTTSHL